MIRLEYSVELTYEVEGEDGADLFFNVHAAQTAHQHVVRENLSVSDPVVADVVADPGTSTRLMRVHAPAGPFRLNYDAWVDIDHHVTEPDTLEEVPVCRLPAKVLPYVYPSRYCQSDRLLRFAADEFGGHWHGYSRVLAIQHWVQKHVTFRSNSSDSSTSAVDTLIERVGVCRDFAHLMIALSRALNIPARIVSGTDYGAAAVLGPPDFHAYVEVFLGDRWYLFDPAGTGVPMGFIRIGTGRDAADIAFATIFGQVKSMPPLISTRAVEGDAWELPRHRREALSTTGSLDAAGALW